DILPAEEECPVRASIICDEPEDMGRISVELARLQQWQTTPGSVATVISRLLGFSQSPAADSIGKSWELGLLAGRENMGPVALSFDNGSSLTVAGRHMSLAQLVTLNVEGLRVDKNALLRFVDGDAQQPRAGVGSQVWRRQTAKAAADTRHNKPGGSREKHAE